MVDVQDSKHDMCCSTGIWMHISILTYLSLYLFRYADHQQTMNFCGNNLLPFDCLPIIACTYTVLRSCSIIKCALH